MTTSTPEPMFRRTGAGDFPMQLKLLVSGPPKSGKTTLLGSVPNIIVADTEPHANNLQSIAHLDVPYKTIRSTTDLMQLHMVLRDPSLRAQAAQALGMPDIEAVAIDTLDTLQGLMKKERMVETRGQWVRDDWGWLKEEMTKIIEAFTALPMHVIFTVHLKSKELGKGDNAYTVIMPGLEGSIADAIAGMVGYSLLSFREENLQPDGSKKTEYYLRTEGDDTYDFLGTRTAGRLPTVIKPSFPDILTAAKSGRPTQQTRDINPADVAQIVGAPTQAPQAPATPPPPAQAAAQPTAQAAPTSSAPPAPAQPPAQTPVQTPQQQPEQPQQQAQPQQQETPPAAEAGRPASARPTPEREPESPAPAQSPAQAQASEELVSAAAMGHVKKVFDAANLPFPEDKVKEMTMNAARSLVRAWQGAMKDQQEGKIHSATDEISAYLSAIDLAPSNTPPADVETAVQTVQATMGGEVVSVTDDKCETCNNPIDDQDIARLAQGRFGKRLCVSDYIAAGKA